MFYEEEQVSLFDQDMESGKMSLEHCQVLEKTTKERTSQQSLKSSSGSQSRKHPLLMCLRRDGLQADASSMRWETGVLPGESSMPSTGVCHNADGAFAWLQTSTDLMPQRLYLESVNATEKPNRVVETRLTDILETNPDERYNLSSRACQGILMRASRRGKQLPEMLAKALEMQSHTPSKYEADVVGGKGALVQTDKSATLSTLQDQTVFQPKSAGFPLGFRPENVRVYDETATTLCNGTLPGFTTGVITDQPLCIEMTSTKNTVIEDGVCPTLTARMGTGGNQVNAVLERKETAKNDEDILPTEVR